MFVSHFSKTFLGILRKMGIKLVNALMLLCVLLSNFTGIVQARAESREISGSAAQGSPVAADEVYTPPSFVHSEPRKVERYSDSSLNSNFDERTTSSIGKDSLNVGLDVAESGNQFSNPTHLYQSNSCVQPPAGLVDWWTADGDWNDIVGGHHGTPFLGVAFAPGKVGQAFSFDGVDDYLGLGSWFTYQDFTITMWVKPGNTQRTYADIMDNNHRSGVNWVIQQNGGVTNQYSWGQVFNLTADQWQHLTVIHDSSGNYREYLNGNLSGSGNWGAINYSSYNSLIFGRWGGGEGRNWKGLLDEVDVYNRALSETEVVSLFNAGGEGKCHDQSVVSLSSDSIIANDLNTVTIDITLKDSYGNLLPNHTVSLTASGTGNTISPATVQTDINGSAIFFLKSTRAEVKTITIFDQTQGTILYSKPTVTFVPGPVSLQKSTITTDLTEVKNDGVTPATIIVTALDAYDNPVPDATVDVNANGSAVVSQSSAITDAQGKITASITDEMLELITVSAVINDTQILQTVDVHFHCRTNGDLVIPTGDACNLAAGIYTYNSITVQAGGVLIFQGNPSLNQGVTINTNYLTVEASGMISADSAGYQGTMGKGGGPGGGTGAIWTGGGAGYGAQGQDGDGSGGPAYGSVTNPTDLGSAGGSGRCGLISTCPGWAGGGAIHLIVSNTLTVEGTITADGGSGGKRAGGGSGGSILIQAVTLTGAGTIHANGGSDSAGGGSGAGGRIAIYTTNSTYTGIYSVLGGTGYEIAGEGSVYLDSLDLANSIVQISPSQVTADGTTTVTVTVTLKNVNGYLMPNKPVEIAVSLGDGLYVNNQMVNPNQYILIGNTDANGVVTATLTTTTTGTRTIKARSGQELIIQQGTVEFVPGPVSATTSLVTASPASAPADGQTPITVTVTARDSYSNLIQGANVVLQSTGNAVITQPTAPTDNLGRASGGITDLVRETVVITASVDGVTLSETATPTFYGADLAVSLSATAPTNLGTSSSHATAGYPITYTLQVKNLGLMEAAGVSVTDTLPVGLTFISANGVYNLDGSTVTWNLGSLAAGETVSLELIALIAEGVSGQITNTATASTPAAEESYANNTAAQATTVETPVPVLELSPTSPTLNVIRGESASLAITVTNRGLAEMINVTILPPPHISWAAVDPASLAQLAPGASQDFTVFASPPLTQEAGIYQDYITVSADSGQLGYIALTLEVASEETRDLQVTAFDLQESQPITTSGRVLLTRLQPATLQLPSGEQVSYQPQYSQRLDPGGAAQFSSLEAGDYAYHVFADGYAAAEGQLTMQPGNGAQGQNLYLDADHFIYTWEVVPMDVGYEITLYMTYEYEGGPPAPAPDWCHPPECSWGDNGGTWHESGNGVNVPLHVPPPTYEGNHHETAQLELSQAVMLEGEGFNASLWLENTSADALQNLSVEIKIQNADLQDQTGGFIILPETPALPGSLAVGDAAGGDWLILPSGLNVSDPNGVKFLVSALVAYRWAGADYSFQTVPQWVTVYPAPDLALHYELPSPEEYCTEFDLRVLIENKGLGWARDVRFNTAQPVVTSATGHPVSFEIVSAIVGGVPQANVLNLELGDIPPGEQLEILWRLRSDTPGRFIAFSAEYHQSNYLGVPMTPLISEVTTELVDTACQGRPVPSDWPWCFSGDRCIGGALSGTQGQTGGPISTRTGSYDYSMTDISIPTPAGPLTFQRWYSSRAIDADSELLGNGWTHNLDTRLIFPGDPGGRAGVILFKAHSSNRYEFTIHTDGTYSPYPGMCGQLQRQGEGYAFTDNSQWVYTFDAAGRLASLSDPQGAALHYEYDVEGRLQQVSDPSTPSAGQTPLRYLELSYDDQGRIASVADHSGRQVSFGYDIQTGDLITATDVMEQTWIYQYSDPAHPHFLTEVVDPGGVTVERTEFDSQGRAVRQYNGAGELLVALTYNEDGTTSVVDALGNAATHTYDGRGTLTGQADALGGATSKVYDSNFRPATITDSGGGTTTLAWSANGANLNRVVDADGNETNITYDALNNPTSIVDAGGFLTTFEYDGKLLTSSTDALNQETSYTYTPEGNLASVTDPLNRITTYTYDVHGQRISMTDPSSQTWTYTYDDLGRLTDTTDPLGRVTHSVYDAAGHLTSQTLNYDAGKSQNQDNKWNIVTSYQYDARGNQIAVTDTLSRTTQYAYDNAGRLITVISDQLLVSSNQYNAAGQLISTTDALLRVTQYEYDAAGRLVKTIDALGNATNTVYNADGTVASTTDALGRETSYTYDSLKRVVAVTQPNGETTHNTYNGLGNLVTTTDVLGNNTHYEYDALGRMIKTTDALGNFTENFYNAAGQLVQTRDARGNATTYAYDAAGRQFSVTDALGNITSYQYDALGRRTSVTDALGNESTFTYDELNRTVAVTDALGHTSTMSYDALGQTLTRTDPNNQSVSFSYDNLGRLISQTDALNHSVSFTYDAVGNRLTTTDANGHTTSNVYDALNRPLSFTDANGISGTNGYDAAGNLVTSTDGLGNTTVTTYNALNQPIVYRDALGNETTQAYNARGELVATTDAEGLTTGYEYDALGRLTAVLENYKPGFQATAEINVRTEYTYDANGNRLGITDGNGHTTSFTYDALNRLVSETDPLGNTWSYAYRRAGQPRFDDGCQRCRDEF